MKKEKSCPLIPGSIVIALWDTHNPKQPRLISCHQDNKLGTLYDQRTLAKTGTVDYATATIQFSKP